MGKKRRAQVMSRTPVALAGKKNMGNGKVEAVPCKSHICSGGTLSFYNEHSECSKKPAKIYLSDDCYPLPLLHMRINNYKKRRKEGSPLWHWEILGRKVKDP